MKLKSLFSNIAASSISKISTLLLNGAYFLVVAVLLPKSEFGIYALCMASTAIIAQLLTVGTTQVIVRTIASRSLERKVVLGNILFQRISFPAVFALVSLPILIFWPEKLQYPWLLAIAFASNAVSHCAMGLRSTLIAEQRFWYVALAQLSALLAKIAIGLTLILLGFGAIGLFIALLCGGFIEGIIAACLVRKVFGVWAFPRWNRSVMFSLLKDGFPLMLGLLFNQSLARVDWVLMGIIHSEAKTGEYAFAYKIFELCWLPHAIISTILLPRLSYALRDSHVSRSQKNRLNSLHRVMISIAVLLPLAMCLAWAPVIDHFTHGKYGLANLDIIYILAIAVPFTAGINVMWSLALARRYQKTVMICLALAAVLNIGLNLLLLPRFGGIGAAVATTASMVLQYIVYVCLLRSYVQLRMILTAWASASIAAATAFYVAYKIIPSWFLQVIVATLLFISIVYILGGVRKSDMMNILGRTNNTYHNKGTAL